MTTFLADLTVTEWVCIVLGSWLIAAVLIAPRIGRMIRRADEAEGTADDDTRWLPFLPPVPPPVRIPDFYVASDWSERSAS